MLTGALQDKIRQLAVQLPCGWNSWLSQAARPSRELALFWKTWLFTFHSHPSINTLYTHERKRASRENFERETLEKKQNWFIHNLYIRDSSNSSTLFLSIVKFLRGLLPKLFSHHIHFCERAVWCFGKQLGRNQFYIGWYYGQVVESGKLENK